MTRRVEGAASAQTPAAVAPAAPSTPPVRARGRWRPVSGADPHAGSFTLEAALEGLGGEGALIAEIHTSMGSMECSLRESETPTTVANFVGLARGKRAFWNGHEGEWTRAPLYDGTTFHRVIPGFMIQGGDPAGTGAGQLGFSIADEIIAGDRHDRAGLLCMANRGPNTNEGQFFITDGAAPHLDGGYTIFGECAPTETVARIARVEKGRMDRPVVPVVIERVVIRRND